MAVAHPHIWARSRNADLVIERVLALLQATVLYGLFRRLFF